MNKKYKETALNIAISMIMSVGFWVIFIHISGAFLTTGNLIFAIMSTTLFFLFIVYGSEHTDQIKRFKEKK